MAATQVVKTAAGTAISINGVVVDPTGATAGQYLTLSGGKFVPGAGPGVGTLAATYAAGVNGASSTISYDSTRLNIKILDAASSIGTLFQIRNNADSSSWVTFATNAMNFIKGGLADSGTAVGLAVDTNATWSNATSKILRILTGGSERFAFTGQGNFLLQPAASISSASIGGTNTVGMTLAPNVTDGASTTGLSLDLTTSIASGRFLRIRNAGTQVLVVKPNNTDGVTLTDGSSALSNIGLSTNAGTTLSYSTANVSIGSGTLSMTDGTKTWTLTSGVMTGAQLKSQATNSSQTQALQSWRDSNGNGRFGVDMFGLPSLGSRFEMRENWLWVGTAAGGSTALTASATNAVISSSNNAWSYTSTVNATGFSNISGFATGSPIQSGITIGSGTAAGNSMFLKQTTPALLFNLTNMVIVAEWAMVTSVTGVNSVTYAAGLSNNGVNVAHPGGAWFQKASTDTNWQCATDSGTVGPAFGNSGVPPVAATAQMFRIEMYGSTTPLGAATVKFYIDNTLVTTTTTNMFTAGGSLIFSAYNTATGAVAQRNLSIGPILLMYNMVATPLIP